MYFCSFFFFRVGGNGTKSIALWVEFSLLINKSSKRASRVHATLSSRIISVCFSPELLSPKKNLSLRLFFLHSFLGVFVAEIFAILFDIFSLCILIKNFHSISSRIKTVEESQCQSPVQQGPKTPSSITPLWFLLSMSSPQFKIPTHWLILTAIAVSH
jgi:hypothetical protein